MPKTKTAYQWWRNATFWPVVCMALGSERRWFTSYFKKKDASPWWLVFHMLRLKITLMHTKAPPIDSSVSWIIALLFIEDPVELSKWALTGVHPSSRFIFFSSEGCRQCQTHFISLSWGADQHIRSNLWFQYLVQGHFNMQTRRIKPETFW